MILVASAVDAEIALRGGGLACPGCAGRLRPYGHGRTRTVRGPGAARLTVTPRRARCGSCRATHILLPAALSVRMADTTEAIGVALAAKARGDGHRTIAARLGRPVSTVRRWLRRASPAHARWLYQQGIEHLRRYDSHKLAYPKALPTLLGQALNALAGAALTYERTLGSDLPPWTLIGIFARGHLLGRCASETRRTGCFAMPSSSRHDDDPAAHARLTASPATTNTSP